jgi:acetylornithine deacetylase/succinyl-diaminopimelate desuccinylase-like protein
MERKRIDHVLIATGFVSALLCAASAVSAAQALTTDGSYLRNAGIPTYGHTGRAGDVDDVRAHGQDERVSKTSYFDGQEYLYRLVKRLAGPQ